MRLLYKPTFWMQFVFLFAALYMSNGMFVAPFINNRFTRQKFQPVEDSNDETSFGIPANGMALRAGHTSVSIHKPDWLWFLPLCYIRSVCLRSVGILHKGYV